MNTKSSLLMVLVSFGILTSACSASTVTTRPVTEARLTIEPLGDRPEHSLHITGGLTHR